MFKIKIADIVISIDNKYSFIERISKDYLVNDVASEISVSVTDEEISKEREFNDALSDPFIESVCIYRKIAQALPKYDAFVLHCASVEYDENAFCFLGRSGTGKTTHIRLWRRILGDKVQPINGDKPIIRRIDGKFFVCGTPWGGKEMLQRNTIVPMKGICELSQSENNSIAILDKHKAITSLLSHVFIPHDSADFDKTVSLVAEMIDFVPTWHLKCNISEDAARLSFNTMNG